MTLITYEAEYPGVTAKEALLEAEEAERDLPFRAEWSQIDLSRFWEGHNSLVADHKDDYDVLQEFREKEWAWVATLKARGTV